MAGKTPSFTVGIEEEYLLVDRATRDLVSEPPPDMIAKCEDRLRGQVASEFLQTQIEVGTRVCATLQDARDDLAYLRGTVAEVANEFGLAPIAASTHPFGRWRDQKPTDKQRYAVLEQDMQVAARRLLICGMHVHVGLDDDELAIDILNQIPYFLPHLLALSTSSPFWEGAETGLKSYRLCVFNELPRTGLPEQFASHGEYRRTVDALVRAGLIEDATKIWWDVRPSARFPTLEMRITDVCTRLDDAISIAAIYRCLCRALHRLRRNNQRWRVYSRFLVDENRWRAQRYGFDEGLVDFGRGEIVPFETLLDEIIDLLREDAEFFGCQDELEHARTIIARGSSAHRQLATYHLAMKSGADHEAALKSVVDMLIEDTVAGL
ncbi:MAG: carboxylate-amine ligase [Rhodospirillales bacterium]|nr:carboxylate-amine ligase [Rhodospirillales bacterium]